MWKLLVNLLFNKILLQYLHLHLQYLHLYCDCDWRCQGEDDLLASWHRLQQRRIHCVTFVLRFACLLPCVLVFCLENFFQYFPCLKNTCFSCCLLISESADNWHHIMLKAMETVTWYTHTGGFESLVVFSLYLVWLFSWFSFCLTGLKISTAILMASTLRNTGVNTSIMILAVQSNVDTSIMVRFHSK